MDMKALRVLEGHRDEHRAAGCNCRAVRSNGNIDDRPLRKGKRRDCINAKDREETHHARPRSTNIYRPRRRGHRHR